MKERVFLPGGHRAAVMFLTPEGAWTSSRPQHILPSSPAHWGLFFRGEAAPRGYKNTDERKNTVLSLSGGGLQHSREASEQSPGPAPRPAGPAPGEAACLRPDRVLIPGETPGRAEGRKAGGLIHCCPRRLSTDRQPRGRGGGPQHLNAARGS